MKAPAKGFDEYVHHRKQERAEAEPQDAPEISGQAGPEDDQFCNGGGIIQSLS